MWLRGRGRVVGVDGESPREESNDRNDTMRK
jgi:hypothetical protein